MSRRSDDADQSLHPVAAGCSAAQVRPQCRGKRGGVGSGAPNFELLSDELTHLGRLQMCDHDGPVGEPVQQQAFYDAQATTTRALRQTSNIAHVLVIATEFLSDGANRRRCFGNHPLFAKHVAQVSARGTDVTVSAHHRARAVAAWQMPYEEPLDSALIQQSQRQL